MDFVSAALKHLCVVEISFHLFILAVATDKPVDHEI